LRRYRAEVGKGNMGNRPYREDADKTLDVLRRLVSLALTTMPISNR